MSGKYNLNKMLAEIKQDQVSEGIKDFKLSGDAVRKLVAKRMDERRKAKRGD